MSNDNEETTPFLFNIKTEVIDDDKDNFSAPQNKSSLLLSSAGLPTTVIDVGRFQSLGLNDHNYVFNAPSRTKTYMKCCVPSCNIYFDRGRQQFMGVSYFPFPDDPVSLQRWVQASKLPNDFQPGPNTMVCLNHFRLFSTYIRIKTSVPRDDVATDNNVTSTVMQVDLDNVSDEPKQDNIINNSESDGMPVISSVLSLGTPSLLHAALGGSKSIQPTENIIKNSRPKRKCTEVRNIGPINEIKKGLVTVPASVKLPPKTKINIMGDGIFCSETNVDNIDSSLVGSNENRRGKRKRSNKEDMKKREEEEDWEPSKWGRMILVKDGFGSHLVADKSRKFDSQTKNIPLNNAGVNDGSHYLVPPNEVIQDGLEEEDEGWRIVEPLDTQETTIGENDDEQGFNEDEDCILPLSFLEVSLDTETNPVQSSDNECSSDSEAISNKKPGPASKTSRPRYIQPMKETECAQENTNVSAFVLNKRDKPPPYSNLQNCVEECRESVIKSTTVISATEEPTQESLHIDSNSLLSDWSFFKSLIPDLKYLTTSKRLEFKNFVLDILSNSIYGENPTISSDGLK